MLSDKPFGEISPNLQVWCIWDKDEVVRLWGQKVKRRGNDEIKYGQKAYAWAAYRRILYRLCLAFYYIIVFIYWIASVN